MKDKKYSFQINSSQFRSYSILFFSVFIVISKAVPLWHEPNDVDANGQDCALSRPSKEVTCPYFGVSLFRKDGTSKSREEIEKQCQEDFKLACDNNLNLLPDGHCGDCKANPSLCDVTHWTNPFNCLEEDESPPHYLPCPVNATQLKGVRVLHFSEGLNLQNQQVLEACADRLSVSDKSTIVDLYPLGDHTFQNYSFPLIYDPKQKSVVDFGFLQCPLPEEKEYNFASAFWTALYGFFGCCFGIIFLFSAYKFIQERKAYEFYQPTCLNEEVRQLSSPWEDTDELELIDLNLMSHSFESTKSPKLQSDKTAATITELFPENSNNNNNNNNNTHKWSPHHHTTGLRILEDEPSHKMKQVGFRSYFIGRMAYSMLWIGSIGWLLLLFMIILDFYGLHVWTLCDSSAREDCEHYRLENPDDYFTLRTGYTCGSGCFFSRKWTTGTSRFWPYYNDRSGGHQVDAIFIFVWHVTLLWFIILKALQPKIRSFFDVRCPLSEATTVLITSPKEPEVFVEGDSKSFVLKIAKALDSFRDQYLSGGTVTVACRVQKSLGRFSYFDYKCARYCWSDAAGHFVRAHIHVGSTYEQIRRTGGGLMMNEVRRRYEAVGGNVLSFEIHSLSTAIFLEFFDWFYMYQFFCLLVWMAFHYWAVSVFIAIAIVISGLLKVRMRRNSQLQVKRLATMFKEIKVLREGRWCHISSSELVPGDVICIERGPVVCDCVLLEGACTADESSLTGEPTPVGKFSLESGGVDGQEIYSTSSGVSLKFTLLAGTTVEAIRVGPNGFVTAVVMSTGATTEKGKLIREMLYPPPLSFKFDQHWKLVFLILLCWGFLVFCVCMRLVKGNLVGWYYGLSTISQIMSPLIPAVFVAARAQSAKRLLQDHRIHCVNFDRILVGGKVKIFCFDKTGTLTKPGLEFHSIVPIDSRSATFEDQMEADRNGKVPNAPDLVKLGMACAHELVLLGPSSTERSVPTSSKYVPTVGNKVDKSMFAASGFELILHESRYLAKKDTTTASICIIKRFAFDRSTMLMSCIVDYEHEADSRFIFVKGTFETILANSNASVTPTDFLQRARSLARDGYYVLALAYKSIPSTIEIDTLPRSSAESDLTPLSLLIFNNELKAEAAEVIRELKEGSIRPVMVTGDSPLTAIKVSVLCGLCTAPKIILGDTESDSHSIDWRDVETGEFISSLADHWNDMETGRTELAITGHAFDKLAQMMPVANNGSSHELCSALKKDPSNDGSSSTNNSQLRSLLRYIRIFARMKPNQKVQAIQLHMMMGVTAMCGDGANDAGALRIAHVGIALGNANETESPPSYGYHDYRRHNNQLYNMPYEIRQVSEATLVAPFSVPSSNLRATTSIIKEGRCALATSLAAYKDLMMYGEIMVAISLVMYYYGVNLSEMYWISVDSLVNIGMAWAIIQTKPNKILTPIRPSSKLLGTEVISSILLQIVINLIFLALCMVLLFGQSFFVCREFNANLIEQNQWWKKADNYEAEVIAILSFFQIVNAAAVFNFGFDYRQPWRKNQWVVFLWLLGVCSATVLLFSPPSYISCLYRVNCGDQSLLEAWSRLGKIWRIGRISIAPEGCPCDQQIAFSPTCENEYLHCKKSHYNQTYHHNILPYSFRGKFYLLILLNTMLCFFCEWFFIVGPIRKKLRKRKFQLKTQAKLLSGHQTSFNKRREYPMIESQNRFIIGQLDHNPYESRFQGIGLGGVCITEEVKDDLEGEISVSTTRRIVHNENDVKNGTPLKIVGKPLD